MPSTLSKDLQGVTWLEAERVGRVLLNEHLVGPLLRTGAGIEVGTIDHVHVVDRRLTGVGKRDHPTHEGGALDSHGRVDLDACDRGRGARAERGVGRGLCVRPGGNEVRKMQTVVGLLVRVIEVEEGAGGGDVEHDAQHDGHADGSTWARCLARSLKLLRVVARIAITT